jgi:hypothetical protein
VTLDRAEWDFRWAKDLDQYAIIKCCHDYEFARELPDVIKEKIVSWRKDAVSTDFTGLLDHSWRIGRIGVIRNFYPFPEWPDSPIRSIDQKVLSARVEQLGYPLPYKGWKDEALAAKIDPKMTHWYEPRAAIELSIPEAHNQEELLLFFGAYMRVHFPDQCGRNDSVRPVGRMKGNLRRLGALRLLKVMKAEEASEYTRKLLDDKTQLYATDSKWSRAKSEAAKVINEFVEAVLVFS